MKVSCLAREPWESTHCLPLGRVTILCYCAMVAMIGLATEGTAPSVKEPRIGCGLNFITVDQYSVVTTQDINIRSQWVAARGSAGCELYLAFL